MKKDFAFYRKLFTSTFYLSAFTFGGGYVIIPLMRKKFVEQFHWIEETEMLDLTAIAQSAPGPIAVNASILIGYRLAGFAGAMVSTLGTVLSAALGGVLIDALGVRAMLLFAAAISAAGTLGLFFFARGRAEPLEG